MFHNCISDVVAAPAHSRGLTTKILSSYIGGNLLDVTYISDAGNYIVVRITLSICRPVTSLCRFHSTISSSVFLSAIGFAVLMPSAATDAGYKNV